MVFKKITDGGGANGGVGGKKNKRASTLFETCLEMVKVDKSDLWRYDTSAMQQHFNGEKKKIKSVSLDERRSRRITYERQQHMTVRRNSSSLRSVQVKKKDLLTWFNFLPPQYDFSFLRASLSLKIRALTGWQAIG